jgi:hypothetical protein
MIVHDVEQGSPEWRRLRLGIPTASNFHRIISPKTLKLSAASHGYLCELVAERLLGEPMDADKTMFMERGSELEEQAVAYYELQRDVETTRVGFVTDDDCAVGCSPDRLVGDDGGLEIKCPGAAQHVSNMLEMTAHYMPQVQGTMWLTGRDWWDLLSFHPALPPVIVRIERDEEYIERLAEAVCAFNVRLDQATEQLKAETRRDMT